MSQHPPGESHGNWTFVASKDADVNIDEFPDALAAAPPEVAAGGRLLPRRRVDEQLCRICGLEPAATREHVPPRAGGNDRTARTHTLEEWLDRESLDSVPGGRVEQGGIYGYTLCSPCNTRSGRFAVDYGNWTATCVRLVGEFSDTVADLDQLPVLREVVIQLKPDVRPSAFARQVLASMCSAAGAWNIATRYPIVRDLVLGDDPGELPAPLELAMGLFVGPHAFIAGPSLQVNLPTKEWRWITVIAYPPFAFELVLAADWNQPQPLCRIDNFLADPASIRGTVELDAPVLFSHTPFPGDWRNRYQIEHRLNIDGSPGVVAPADSEDDLG